MFIAASDGADGRREEGRKAGPRRSLSLALPSLLSGTSITCTCERVSCIRSIPSKASPSLPPRAASATNYVVIPFSKSPRIALPAAVGRPRPPAVRAPAANPLRDCPAAARWIHEGNSVCGAKCSSLAFSTQHAHSLSFHQFLTSGKLLTPIFSILLTLPPSSA